MTRVMKILIFPSQLKKTFLKHKLKKTIFTSEIKQNYIFKSKIKK